TAIEKLSGLVSSLSDIGIVLQHFNFGGGLAVPYRDDDSSQEQLLADYASIINKHAARLNTTFIFEPGRFIVANAGILVTQVCYVKPVTDKCFVIVDAAMNDLLRPTLYEAWHKVAQVELSSEPANTITADIVGPVCESGDYLALNRTIVAVKENDLLALHSAGAYGAVQASSYNSRPLIAEVLVEGDRWHTIRQSPSHQQLIALDSIPSWV
ncbi:MAG: diaminopimelate decarboxylase, partial [Oceanospirillaceae bacterium]